MVAQHGLKGTSCPSHYHVIKDDCNDNVELLQKLTFELCHLYARATKIVSRPAPVYYAHRAAFLAQYYKDDYKEDNMWEVSLAINLAPRTRPRPSPSPSPLTPGDARVSADSPLMDSIARGRARPRAHQEQL